MGTHAFIITSKLILGEASPFLSGIAEESIFRL